MHTGSKTGCEDWHKDENAMPERNEGTLLRQFQFATGGLMYYYSILPYGVTGISIITAIISQPYAFRKDRKLSKIQSNSYGTASQSCDILQFIVTQTIHVSDLKRSSGISSGINISTYRVGCCSGWTDLDMSLPMS
jgi:hypothetical protein